MGGSSGGSGRWTSIGDMRSLEEKAKEALRQGRRNVFISFAYEDINEVNLLRGQAKNENNDLEFNDRSVHEPFDSERADYIKRRLAERINQSSTTVVYVSEHTSKSSWVQWEVEKSLELGKRVIAVYAGAHQPANMPAWLRDRNIVVTPWSELSSRL